MPAFHRHRVAVFIACLVASTHAYSADSEYAGMLDTASVGVADFLKGNPVADGRGVVIAILDSGVDVDTPGLKVTSTNENKILVARDFTDEGLVRCGPIDVAPEGTAKTPRGVVNGLKVRDGVKFFAGFLDEVRFRGTAIQDLNRNGRNDDSFAVVVVKAADGAFQVLVDTVGDWNMSDAVEVGPWEVTFKPLKFIARQAPDINAAVNVGDGPGGTVDVGFHIAAGSHGTHVAGIAAGFGIGGRPGFDGIAPGAKILSLKIGHGGLSGGATVSSSMMRALDFAADWGKRNKAKVVANVSYGVGSVLEGHSAIDSFCRAFSERNPDVLIVASAGNNGPGLSTVGSPAASPGVLTIGAVLSPSIGSEQLGAESMSVPTAYAASSRGGEAAKPDVAAPGLAVSTIPGWVRGDTMSGTSMAAPQVAGVAAVVMSGILGQNPQADFHSGMVLRALKASARPVNGFGPLDVGSGIVDAVGAFKALRKSLSNSMALAVSRLDVETEVPTLGGRKGQALFWRASGWAPGRADAATVTVRPVFSRSCGADCRKGFFGRFKVFADSRWIGVSKRGFHVSGDGSASFQSWVEKPEVLGPGVHTGLIRVVSEGGVEAAIPVTVVVPHPDSPVDGVRRILMRSLRIPKSSVMRIPFDIPDGASSVAIRAVAADGARATASVSLHDGQGNTVHRLSGMIHSEEGRRVEASMSPSGMLEKGTCELVISGGHSIDSVVDLEISFGMISVTGPATFELKPGKTPVAFIEAVNRMPGAFTGSVKASIDGFETVRSVRLNTGAFEEGFSIGRDFDQVLVDIEFDSRDFAKFTDVSVNVVDRDGERVVQRAMNGRRLAFSVKGGEGHQSDFRLQVTPAFANGGEAVMKVTMTYIWKEQIQLSATLEGAGVIRLYPGIPATLRLEASSTPPAAPSGAAWFGRMDFVDRKDSRSRAMLEFRAVPR
ncbi:MAG TPA: S8 family serine peptidase [Myxococcota bacterium]|nr:S8 family serine peptidase [Myxococcota bacterium]